MVGADYFTLTSDIFYNRIQVTFLPPRARKMQYDLVFIIHILFNAKGSAEPIKYTLRAMYPLTP